MLLPDREFGSEQENDEGFENLSTPPQFYDVLRSTRNKMAAVACALSAISFTENAGAQCNLAPYDSRFESDYRYDKSYTPYNPSIESGVEGQDGDNAEENNKMKEGESQEIDDEPATAKKLMDEPGVNRCQTITLSPSFSPLFESGISKWKGGAFVGYNNFEHGDLASPKFMFSTFLRTGVEYESSSQYTDDNNPENNYDINSALNFPLQLGQDFGPSGNPVVPYYFVGGNLRYSDRFRLGVGGGAGLKIFFFPSKKYSNSPVIKFHFPFEYIYYPEFMNDSSSRNNPKYQMTPFATLEYNLSLVEF